MWSLSLADFDGPRWWRVGVEAFLWDKTRGNSFDPDVVRDLLVEKSGVNLQRSTPELDPVVRYDQDYRPTGTFLDLQGAVRICPDDWPSFADQAWVSVMDVRESESLRAVVITEDLDKLNANE